MPSLPTGTVTFLFTDIEGSTRLLQDLGDRYADVLAEQRRLLRAAFHEKGGQEVDSQGDAFFIAFPRAKDAVVAAVAAQRVIASSPWPGGAAVRVRIALHTGEPLSAGAAYVGLDVHRAARICAVGHGGQILLSETTRALIVDDLAPGVSVRDLGEHHLKDLARPLRLFQVIAADLPSEFPPLRSLDTLPNNLPRQLTSFVGRGREMAEVKRLLSTTYLLTLSGSGGCGKTRLALQVAADLLEEFADGVWLVELAALLDPALVPQAVASALGVREEPLGLDELDGAPGPPSSRARPLRARLLDYFQSKQLLLILDNCEHLIDACAQLAETLLRACPNLRILATSREALGIAGETAWRVPSLSLPDRQLPPVESLMEYEALRLFIDRAKSALPTFTVTDQSGPTVIQICQRLDGIPLAIELAAARVKVLSAEQIAARLDDRFRLLTGGSRTALPRQQTLRAAIDWSHNLLSKKERVLFRRLSVFVGGFTLEAAEAVCTGKGVEAAEVLDVLTHLVDKSLVVVDEQPGEARYRLLDTVRQYGRDRLLESKEAPVVRQRHRDWYLGLAERAEPELHGPDQGVWLDRLETEHDNLRAALEWSFGGGEPEAGLRLAQALHYFWLARGYLSEGRRWLEEALSGSSGASTPARANALFAAGLLANFQGDYERAAALAEESLSLSRALGYKEGIALSLFSLGAGARVEGDLERAIGLFRESLALFRELGDQLRIAFSLRNLGITVGAQGDYEQAATLVEESLALSREMGYKRYAALSLVSLGSLASRRGEYGRATALLEESLVLVRGLRLNLLVGSCLEGLAAVVCAQGQFERAARLYGAAEALREAVGVRLWPDGLAEHNRNVAAVRTGLGGEAFTSAWAQGRAMTPAQAIAYALREV